MNAGGSSASGDRRFLAPWALLPDGWRSDVVMTVDAGGSIAAVEARRETDRTASLHVLPGPVVPAMADVHTHSFQRLLAGRMQTTPATGEDDFWSWRQGMYRLANRIAPESLTVIAAFVYSELLAAGYTRIGEFHYLHRGADGAAGTGREMGEALLHAAGATGVALTLLPALYQYGGFGQRPASSDQQRFLLALDEYLELHAALGARAAACGQPAPGVAVHSLRAVDPMTAAELRRALPALPFHLHIAEQPAEVEACIAQYGITPIRLALDRLDLDAHCCLVHATHGMGDELAAVAACGAVVALCPGTEADLGDGLFPLADFLAQGGRFALGSDSNATLSPFTEVQRLEHQARLVARRRHRLAPPGGIHSGTWLWQHAAQAGAHALGAAGGIAAGRPADWLVLKPLTVLAETLPVEHWLDAAILGEALVAIDEVYAGGVRRVAGGRHLEAERYGEALRAVLKDNPGMFNE